MSKNGALSRSGLLSLDKGRLVTDSLDDKLALLSPNFADNMVSLDADPVVLLRDVVFPCAPPHLTTDDFPHLVKELGVLQPYLKKSVATGRKGVNILLHGEPGTGKSQLAKILAAETGCELFEVAGEDGDGDPRVGSQRLRAFQAAQNILSNQKMMILFDEIEDVFNSGGHWCDYGDSLGVRRDFQPCKHQAQPQSLDQPETGREPGTHIMVGKCYQWNGPGFYSPFRYDHQTTGAAQEAAPENHPGNLLGPAQRPGNRAYLHRGNPGARGRDPGKLRGGSHPG